MTGVFPAPTREGDRLFQLDVIRGIALLGVLLINIDLFSGAFWALQAKLPYPAGWGGNLLTYLRGALVEGKAVALLSILFGAGMMIQVDRARLTGANHLAFTLRRLGALALFGLAHSLLLWNGDILIDYALLGLMVLPFLNVRPRRVLWAIPILLVVAVLLVLPFMGLIEKVEGNPGGLLQMHREHYGNGSWLDALRFRAWEFLHVVGPLRIQGRLVMCSPFFILGVFFWKLGWLAEPGRHRRQLTKLAVAGLIIGLTANLLPADSVFAWAARIPFRPLRVFLKLTYVFGKAMLALGYLGGLLLLLERTAWHKRTQALAALGRLALTQYLMQSVVCSLVFCGFGLGLFERVPLNICIGGAVLFFMVQAWSSRLWLRRFTVGPCEWLWRRLIYGGPQPFRRK